MISSLVPSVCQSWAEHSNFCQQHSNDPWVCACRCEVDQPYSLAACGHVFCKVCLQAMLESSTRNNDFPVKCCAGGCQSLISLADFSCLLPAQLLSESFRAAFRSFVETKHDAWGCCTSPDCPQVGPSTNAQRVLQSMIASIHPIHQFSQVYKKDDRMIEFQCDCCLASCCTHCLVPFHRGQTCAE